MLRARTQRTTDSTGVRLTVTHGIGATPDAWWVEQVSDRGLGRTYFVDASNLSNTIDIINDAESTVTVDVFTIAYQGRLY